MEKDVIEYDHLFKLLLVGDSGVGKTSILIQFHTGRFAQLKPTIGVDLKVKLITLRNQRIKLTIWDTAGQERFRTLTSSFYRGAHGIILVYDITSHETFEHIEKWLKEVNIYSTNIVKLLVGNKIDKEIERAVTKEEGQSFARKHNMLFIETSAKTAIGVQQAFEELTQKILDLPENNEKKETDILRVSNECRSLTDLERSKLNGRLQIFPKCPQLLNKISILSN